MSLGLGFFFLFVVVSPAIILLPSIFLKLLVFYLYSQFRKFSFDKQLALNILKASLLSALILIFLLGVVMIITEDKISIFLLALCQLGIVLFETRWLSRKTRVFAFSDLVVSSLVANTIVTILLYIIGLRNLWIQ